MPKFVSIPLVIILLLLAGAAGVYYLINRPPEATVSSPDGTPPPTSTAPATSAPSTEPLEQRIENLQKEIESAVRSGTPKEVSLVITEDEANSRLVPSLVSMQVSQGTPLEIKSASMSFQPDIIVTSLKIAYSGFTINTQVKTKLLVKDGKPALEIVDISFGSLPLPDFIKSFLTSFIQQEIQDIQTRSLSEAISIADADWELTSVKVESKKLSFTLLVKPRTG